MVFFRNLKTRISFLTGKLQIVKVLEANEDEMLCSDGSRIKIQEQWKENLAVFKPANSDHIDYVEPSEAIDATEPVEGVLTILKNRQFIGILVYRTEVYEAEYGNTPQIVGLNVINGAQFTGWFSGDIKNYCRHVMNSNFASNAEWLMKKERNVYGSDDGEE